MATPSEEILPQLLALPATERAILADRLLESLGQPDEKNRELWAIEAERRLDAFDQGKMDAIPADEVFSRYGV